MNKQQAFNNFWGSFGVLAFEENAVPDDDTIQNLINSGAASSKFPYITYQVIVDDINAPIFPTASIWDRSSSWERADLLSNQISEHIQKMRTLKLDNGRMFITKGSPFAQHMSDGEESPLKRIVLNLGVEFFTEY